MKKITTVLIGNTNHTNIDMMKFSLENSLENVDAEDVLIFSNEKFIDYGTFIPMRDKFTIDDYNLFTLKNLWAHVRTEFVLIVQYDGIAANKKMWSNDFYNYDYIGAPWPDRFNWIAPEEKVGNGGFSLRSMKLLDALKDPNIFLSNDLRGKGEDAAICQKYNQYLRTKYDIKYAPVEVANQFAHEWNNPTGNTFGFHGVWNFPLFYSEEVCLKHLLNVHKGYWYNDRYEMFVQNCQKKGYITLLSEVTKGLMSK